MQQDAEQIKEVRFKFNYNNPKDVIISEFLAKEYNHNEFIKALLYKLATGGNIGYSMTPNVNLGNIGEINGVTNKLRKDDKVPQDDNLGNNEEDKGMSEEMANEFSEFF